MRKVDGTEGGAARPFKPKFGGERDFGGPRKGPNKSFDRPHGKPPHKPKGPRSF
ncbi:hypothetical protein D3C72_2561050 [compost metagenome]